MVINIFIKNISKNQDSIVPPIPNNFKRLFKKLRKIGLGMEVDENKLQVIVNEYLPGQGIAPHIDDPKQFGEWVISVSLGSSCVVNFTKEKQIINKFINKGSVYQMVGDVRYNWKHGIEQVKCDTIDGIRYNRDRRISITFRYIK